MSKSFRPVFSVLSTAFLIAVAFLVSKRPISETPVPSEPSADEIEIESDTTTSQNNERIDFGINVVHYIEQHCISCHSESRPAGGIDLHASGTLSTAHWQRVSDAVRSGRMPPASQRRPDAKESRALLDWIDQAGGIDPGRVTFRRLNRAEYNHTIRDLVGIDLRPADDFPLDDSGDGFDTNGDVLSSSPLLIEKYLASAQTVIEAARNDSEIWRRITTPPVEDFIPFVLRGNPPLKADIVKDQSVQNRSQEQLSDHEREIERAFYALQAFADRAFRRPVTHVEIGRLMRFVENAVDQGEGVDRGMMLAMKCILLSPHFLFRVELDPVGKTKAAYRLNDFELASRLSYFLWSSMPDETLIRLAAHGQLRNPQTLASQVRRMLRDSKAGALAENFAGQWLQIRLLAQSTPDPDRFPEFNGALRHAMRRETELFFQAIAQDDRSVLELLNGEYTFVNERLARHYGISGITGEDFRRISLAGTGRAGVLTQASVLTITSSPTRTSPVKRGKWVLENLLGVSTPAPPPGADGLVEPISGVKQSIRERLVHHRQRAECASCHDKMDPIGFGLENFDAIGVWRDLDDGLPVDAFGTLPDGRSFRGPAQLRALLREKSDEFVQCLSLKLFTYALGRSMRPADRPQVDKVARHAARNGYRFSSLITALVRSDPFQSRSLSPMRETR